MIVPAGKQAEAGPFARAIAAEIRAVMARHRVTMTLLAELGGVPRTLVWDGESAIGRWRRGTSELTQDCQAFRGILGVKVYICKPADPEAKGMLERLHDYLERSFLPGRSFASPEDFNTQLAGWLGLVNGRRRRVLGCAPTDRITADRQAMLSLPPVAPVTPVTPCGPVGP